MIQAKICSAINSVHNEYSQILGAIINICFIFIFIFFVVLSQFRCGQNSCSGGCIRYENGTQMCFCDRGYQLDTDRQTCIGKCNKQNSTIQTPASFIATTCFFAQINVQSIVQNTSVTSITMYWGSMPHLSEHFKVGIVCFEMYW